MITVNEQELAWREGLTVQGVLDAMKYTWKHIMVTVNGAHVPEMDWDDHPVPDGAEVQAMHIFHGG